MADLFLLYRSNGKQAVNRVINGLTIKLGLMIYSNQIAI